MHSVLKKILVVTVLLSLPFTSFSKEDPVNFIYVDTASYNAYLKKDWKKVIEVAKIGLKYNIDYYYLRMRVGIAQYERFNYMSAINHFKKALEFNSSDTLAEKYVYYSYVYLGDDINAITWLTELSSDWASKELLKKHLFENIYAFYSHRFYDNDNLDSASVKVLSKAMADEPMPIYTQQNINKTYSNYQIGGRLRLSPTWRVEMSYQNFQLVNKQEIVDPFRIITSENSIKQIQWNINNSFKLGRKLRASVYFTYMSYTYDYIRISTERAPVEYIENNGEKDSDFLFGLGLERRQSLFDVKLSTQFLTRVNGSVWQSDLGVKFYPMGNLNFWSMSKFSFIKQSSDTRFVFKQGIHYKPFKRGELAFSACWGDLSYWSDRSGYVIYNGSSRLSSLYQISLTLRLVKKLYVKAYYEYMSNSSSIMSKSLLPQDSGKQEVEIESNQFNTHSIIGGLIWEF